VANSAQTADPVETLPITPDAAEHTSENGAWKYWAFRTLGGVAPWAPLWLARPLAVAGGWLAWALAPGLRRRAEWNLSHIPTLADNPAHRRRVARAAFITLALNYLDFFRGRRVTVSEMARGWEIIGWDDFERAAAQGKGLIALSAHYGPFEYAAWKLGELGRPMITPAERLRPARLHHLVASMRNHHGARMIAGDERESLREMIAALRRGDIVVFAVDRWVMGPSAPWTFFGAEAQLPIAPFALAARSDAPVILVAPRRKGRGSQVGIIELLTPERVNPAPATEPAPGPRSAERMSRDEAVTRMRARVYPALERVIAEEPGQWVSVLSTIWNMPAKAP
jgi:KDO2-lipid IV(A) lauroyltransferase